MQKGVKDITGYSETENLKVFLGLVEPAKEACLLDLGCGDGVFTEMVSEKVGTTQISGVEIQEESVQLCEKKGIRVYGCDLNDILPIDDNTFDVVVANQVIEHLWATDLFLKELYRILKPNGYAVISTPNLATWQNVLAIICGWQLFTTSISDEMSLGNPLSPLNKRYFNGSNPIAHHRVFTYRGIRELLEYHKFKVERIVGVGYFPFPTTLARVLSGIDKRHAMYITVKVRKASNE